MKNTTVLLILVLFLKVSLSGQKPNGYIVSPDLQELIQLYLEGNYEVIRTLMNQYGYTLCESLPDYSVGRVKKFGSFKYCFNEPCRDGQDDHVFLVKFSSETDSELGFTEFRIRRDFYSPLKHEYEEEHMGEFLSKYAHNEKKTTGTGSFKDLRLTITETPESVKKSGDLYLELATFSTIWTHSYGQKACMMNNHIAYEITFRKGLLNQPISKSSSSYYSGVVSTKEGSNLRLRQEPSLQAQIITLIPNGSKVSILEYGSTTEIIDGLPGKWYKIRYEGQVGWAWGNYIVK